MTIKALSEYLGVTKNTVKGRLKGSELIKNDKGIIELTEEQIKTVCDSLGKEPPEPLRTASEPLKTAQEPLRTASEPLKTAQEPLKTTLNQFKTTSEPVRTTQEPLENQSESAQTQAYIDSLNEQIKYLKEQIADRDNTIKELNADYKTLAEKMSAALLNAQTLNAVDKLPAPEQAQEDSETSQIRKEGTKKGVFQRLFKRG